MDWAATIVLMSIAFGQNLILVVFADVEHLRRPGGIVIIKAKNGTGAASTAQTQTKARRLFQYPIWASVGYGAGFERAS